jgi:pimeloyl-ACP methyl ester carboxylesterase
MSCSRVVKVNGLDFNYLDYGGPADGPLIVFYHATGFVSQLWEPVIARLNRNFRCLALDQRGHGGSDKTAAEYSWTLTAEDFLQWLDALGLQHVIGVGHSSGATSIAVTAGRRPELVDRMVLVEPTVRARVVPAYELNQPSEFVERTRGRRARWPDRASLYATLLARPPYASWTEEMKALFAEHALATNAHGELELLCTPQIEADIYASFLRFDPWPDLLKVRQPALVIHGSGPSVMPTTRVKILMPALPSAELVELPQGGHLILMEAPGAVSAAIEKFLSI